MEWMKEFAKAYIGEDKINEFVEGFNKEFPKHAALKSDFNERGEKIKSLEGELDRVGGELKTLKENGNPDEKLKVELERITGEFETYKRDASKREKQWGMKDALKGELGKHFNEDSVDLLLGTFDLNELTTNEAGEIVDLESKIGKLKEARPSLVRDYTPSTPMPKDKETPKETDTSKMSDEEYYQWKATQKEG